MIPLYFPFTYASEAAGARLAGWFDRVSLLVPSADLAAECLGPRVDAGFWQIAAPSPGDEADLEDLETDLRRWAQVHAGSDLAAVLADRDEGSPFSTVPPVSRLRSRIQAGANPQEQPAAKADPLITARVFLRLAHGLDRDRNALQAQMADLSGIEKEMLAELSGKAEDAPTMSPEGQDGEDGGAFLTERRLAAWARLALAVGTPPDVWVTDSRAVIETLGEVAGGLHPVWALKKDVGQTPDPGAGPRLLAEALDGALAGTPAPIRPERTPPWFASDHAIAVYVADLSPEGLCRRMATGAGLRQPLDPPEGRCRVVWIGAATDRLAEAGL